jgi:hypothetical protein
MTVPGKDAPRTWISRPQWRVVIVITAIVAVILAANVLSGWLLDQIEMEVTPKNEPMVHQIIIAAAIIYAFLIALPYVPGIEIGIALMVMFGADLAFLVYVFTVAGLIGGFVIGRVIPQSALRRFASALSLTRVARLIETMEPLERRQRLALLARNAPTKMVPTLLKYRYLALAVGLNIPGNAVIGGGGGIALMAGVTRLFSVPGFIATIAVAVSPVPILIGIFGIGFLP